MGVRHTPGLVKLVAVGASQMLRRWSLASLVVGDGWSRKLPVMSVVVMMVRVLVVVLLLQWRCLLALRHHLHHVAHRRDGVVDVDHAWVVLLVMVAHRLLGSSHVLSRCPLHGGVWQGARQGGWQGLSVSVPHVEEAGQGPGNRP